MPAESGGAPAGDCAPHTVGRRKVEASGGRSAFRWSVDETGLAEVVFDVPGRSVNIITLSVGEQLEALVAEVARDKRIACAVFTSAKEKGFCAGADLAEIAAVEDPDDGRRKVVRGQRAFQRLAELPFPTLAVVHGACLGGGLELALACSHRIAALDAELGLPEVNLGIIPAWGGTQRLARRVGPLAAADLICSARRVDGKAALRLGLVDRVSPPCELRSRAMAFARELAESGPAELAAQPSAAGSEAAAASAPPAGERPGRARGARTRGGRLRRLALERNPLGRKLAFATARKRILERTGGYYPAPLRALQAVEDGVEGSLEAGLALEARLVTDLLVSPVTKNLIHVFELFEGVKRSPWAKAPPGTRPLRRAAVLGAGTMGAGIARLLTDTGLSVRLKDLDTGRVAAGLRAARELLEARRRRGKLDRHGLRRQMNLISGTTDYTGFGRVDLVIEAIVEDLEAKRRAFAELDARTPPHALLCTNTSCLPVSEIAAGVRNRARVAGLHFFNPVHRMPLVEVVRAAETSDGTVGALYGLALRLGKKPVVVRDSPGFLVNRVLMRYLNEAVQLLGQGVDPREIEGSAVAFGMPVGPLALLDDVGLDVARDAGHVLDVAFPDRMQPTPLLEALVAGGRTGRKAGRGFYLYRDGSRKGPDPSVRELARRGVRPAAARVFGAEPAPPVRPAAASGTGRLAGGQAPRRPMSFAGAPIAGAVPSAGEVQAGAVTRPPAPAEIELRLIYPMIDEAARCLAEGVVEAPAELDLAMVAGTGFPAFRGGLLRYADAIGLADVVAVLERLASLAGDRLAPSGALREAAARGGFYSRTPR